MFALRDAVVVVLWLALWSPLAAQSASFDAEKIDAYVKSMMDKHRIPGLSVAVVQGSAFRYLKGFGNTGDGGEVSKHTPFLLGSMSKSFTALAILQLVEAKKLRLKDEVQKHLPWFSMEPKSHSARITVGHLLDHTSGIPRTAPVAATGSSLEAHVKALVGSRLLREPGKKHAYSSPNYQILGLLVEKLSKMSFGAYVQKHIFLPLKMRDSSSSQAKGLPSGHQYWFGYPRPTVLPAEPGRAPTAALLSSARDMGRYLQAHLVGAKLLSPAGFKRLHAALPRAKAKGFSYAKGWRIGPIGGIQAIHHGGILPHFRGKLILLPKDKWGIAVLTNSSSYFGKPSSHLLANGIAALVSGKKPRRQSVPLGRYLGFLWLFLLLMFLNQLWDVWKLRRWKRELPELLALDAKQQRKKLWLPWLAHVAVPGLLFFCIPAIFGVSWRIMMKHAPDLIVYLLVVVGLESVQFGVKTTLLWPSLRSKVEAS